MALCDRLEAQQQERETRHAALARASLARFAEAPTPANLHFIFHKSYAIPPADLRKSILTLAVQGKLVPQDPNDEPAETDSECESSFDIPSNWRWKPTCEGWASVEPEKRHQPGPHELRPWLPIHRSGPNHTEWQIYSIRKVDHATGT